MVKPKERKELLARVAKERGFNPKELEKLGQLIDADECAEQSVYPVAPLFRLYYRDPETGADTGLFRGRYLEEQNGQRYFQRAGSAVEAYYCPLFAWRPVLGDTSIPLLITEGEFKAATACKAGFATIALGGVFNFASKRLKQTWIPSLDKVKWEDRDVYLVYDSDAAVNKQVQLAETRIALRLVERGAHVHIVRLPHCGGER